MATRNPLDAIAKRFGITAREARDIAKAVNNYVSATSKNMGPRGGAAVRGDLVKQVKETGVAAVTGKSGTTAGKLQGRTFTPGVPQGSKRLMKNPSSKFSKKAK